VTRAHFLRMGILCGLTRRETLTSTPGEVGDLWELYLRASGARRDGDADEE